MEFKRYDGFINSSVQKKFDKELTICPLCGEYPNWSLNVSNGFSVVSVTCMCEKCKGKLNTEYTMLNIDNLRVVDVGDKNIHDLSLNASYHILSLKSLESNTMHETNTSVFAKSQRNIIPTQNTTNDNKKKIVAISTVLSVVIILGILLWLIIPSMGTGNSLEPVEKSSMTVEEMYGGYYSVTITGSAKNTSKRMMSYVSITFTLYDSSGNVVGTAIANQSGLGSGETWKYSAIGISTNGRPVSCKSTDVTYLFD